MAEPEDDRTRVHAERRGGILLLTLDGGTTRNAIGPDVYPEVQARIIAAGADPDVRAIVLTGAGGFFSSGGNVRALRDSAARPLADVTANTDKLNAMIRSIVGAPTPVVAAVEGGAAGAGVALALACDMIVAGESAAFTVAHVRVGLSPDGGVTHFLRSSLPHQLVMEMCLLGRPTAAARLAELGVVNRLAPDGTVLAAALELAERVAAGPPEATARIKRQVHAALDHELATHLDVEARAINRARYGAEAAEGLAAFLEKRRPDFTAARDAAAVTGNHGQERASSREEAE
ncbi:oxepin-CoA hydrolase, alternative type [Azospirillum sp. ST 5-10]|uniref:oxepin-CoA hydrolase, alternative type n=1 Tax=unclassified Azospirillum TaxID=2630922 RepID=UPI003F4A30A3